MHLTTEAVHDMVEAIRPLLAGKSAPVQGAVLADLLAIWLAGHSTDRGSTEDAALREELLAHHIKAVRTLISVNEEIIRRDAIPTYRGLT